MTLIMGSPKDAATGPDGRATGWIRTALRHPPHGALRTRPSLLDRQ